MFFGKKTVKSGTMGAGRLGLKMNAKSKSLGRKFAGVHRRMAVSPGVRPSSGMTTLPFKRRKM